MIFSTVSTSLPSTRRTSHEQPVFCLSYSGGSCENQVQKHSIPFQALTQIPRRPQWVSFLFVLVENDNFVFEIAVNHSLK